MWISRWGLGPFGWWVNFGSCEENEHCILLQYVFINHECIIYFQWIVLCSLSWNKEMFLSNGIWTKYFDQTLTCKIKANQSWKIKGVLIAEMTQCLLKWHDKQCGVTKQILGSHTKLNHTS
jgi:hypothetical protein